MLDIIKSYFKKDDYYIVLTKDGLIINNFNNISSMDKDKFSININNKKFIFIGSNFKILRQIDKSIELNGQIERVEINDN